MVRRYAAVFPAVGEEVRVPPECLAEMGLAEGERVVVEVMPGKLLFTTFWDVQAVRSALGGIARDLAEVRARLRHVAGLLPEPPEAGEAAVSDLGADLLGTIEVILADDLEPALTKLQEAVAVTLGPLEEGPTR
jgi:hypothetical protein